jgi:PP-loop superfamily ATP-utilizing enzyme
MRTISYGGGVQSTALLVLAAEEKIDFRIALFANTGDDSEHPATLEFIAEHARPYAERHGIELHEVRRTFADGTTYRTLLQALHEMDGIQIPVRLSGGSPGSRTCTSEWKARTLAKWRKQQGATQEEPCVVAIGISVDEIHRANKKKAEKWEAIEYPLLDLGLRRSDCEQIIRRAGLPVPPKSSCWFCPWKTREVWKRMKAEEPDLFQRAVELDEFLRAKSISKGHGPVYLTDDGPLLRAVGTSTQHDLFSQMGCDEGHCWT